MDSNKSCSLQQRYDLRISTHDQVCKWPNKTHPATPWAASNIFRPSLIQLEPGLTLSGPSLILSIKISGTTAERGGSCGVLCPLIPMVPKLSPYVIISSLAQVTVKCQHTPNFLRRKSLLSSIISVGFDTDESLAEPS